MRKLVVLGWLLCVGCVRGEQGMTGPTGAQGPAGAQGPEGPPGPQGPAGSTTTPAGLRLALAQAEYRGERYVKADFPAVSHTYRLSDLAPIPAKAVAIHVQVTGCIPAGNQNPAFLSLSPGGAVDLSMFISRGCRAWGSEARAFWVPVGASPSVTVTAHEYDIGTGSGVLTSLSVLGWLEPQ